MAFRDPPLLNDTPTHTRRHGFHLRIDWPLFIALLLLAGMGLFVLYSASDQNLAVVQGQGLRILLAFFIMLLLAQIAPYGIQFWSPWLYALGLLLLLAVLVMGEIGKGAQRWLDLGFVTFQPSEIMKLAVPMMIAWYFAEAPLPANRKRLLVAGLLLIIPTLLVAKQPDLGTSLLIASSGVFVLLLAGLSWRFISSTLFIILASTPIAWNYLLHDYQRQRILTFINPENDPLGSGYHIIQSTIAIGSGGIYGKGWLNGTQSHLDFLPERSTDFIFAVLSEEFGFLGVITLLSLYAFIIGRGLIIASQAQHTFGRLLAGSITITFFVYIFVNIGMVSGILPVVGVPLPLISYGGTSVVTLLAGFGILMSIQTHRKLMPT
ncbi:Rod shape-determining protein RodA [hydrothermal vent metagenome]|uniref:Rod shape-determining protein RodA n=1 Tax=hydrothermal vent metagenome TaxID=652676 RepID=A0A3B1AM92_9ZZZZ